MNFNIRQYFSTKNSTFLLNMNKLFCGVSMNYIDKNFYKLTNEIKSLTQDELFQKIKRNYLFLPEHFKKIFEDYFKRFTFWGTLSQNLDDYTEIQLKAKVLKTHINDFIWLYKKLEDYTSKFLLYSIIRNWVYYDFTSLKKSLSTQQYHYFDLDIIPKCKNEVFVDVGAYVGDTTLDLINCYGEDCYKKIFCYEITKNMLPVLNKNLNSYNNIVLRHAGLRDKNSNIFLDENFQDVSANRTALKGSEKVACVTLDDDVKQQVSMIKMDIEGDELRALKGCKKHIMKDKPKLLISIYHKNEHYFQIARLINLYNKNYKFYLRNFGSELYPTEIVLYAI